MVQPGPRLPRHARGWPGERRPGLDGVVGALVRVPRALHGRAEQSLGLHASAHEFVVVLELLPGHQVRWIGLPAAAERKEVLEGLHELGDDVLRLARAVGHLRVPHRVEGADQLVDVHQAFRVRVQAPERRADGLPAVAGEGVVLEDLDELVVRQLARSERLLEHLEKLVDKPVLQLTVVLGGEHPRERGAEPVRADRPHVVGVDLAEGQAEVDDRPDPAAAQGRLYAAQRVLPRELLDCLRTEGHEVAVSPDAADELDRELLVGQTIVRSVAVEDQAHVLVSDPGRERGESALELGVIDPSAAGEVLIPADLHDVSLLTYFRRHPLLNLVQDHLLELVKLCLRDATHAAAGDAAQAAASVAGAASARHGRGAPARQRRWQAPSGAGVIEEGGGLL
mmetsp:Transcript_13643/g.40548  ORF Transcript_13643/g.40548 Transcript_13643/m.40548 type:complete len:396 (-) Transcript_13643:7-1194(-)